MPETSKKSEREAQKKEIQRLRNEELDQINNVIIDLESKVVITRKQNQQVTLLDSVSLGLYEELDKLSKKAPAESVTDLVLLQMNDIIRETKELITSDVYVQRLKEFVAAGDNPQQRDAVIVLRQIRQGLERFTEDVDSRGTHLNYQLSEAKGIQLALQLFLESGSDISEKEIKAYGGNVPDRWLMGSYPNEYFDFEQLNATNIPDYFTSNE